MIQISWPSTDHEEREALGKVFEAGWLGLGSITQEFEEALKTYLGAKHAVAVNTGTSALHLAFSSLGLGPGDEVIVPSITFAGCIQAILWTGATPVFAESLEDSLLLDLADVKRRITSKTKAIAPVHYGGNPADLQGLEALAKAHGLVVVEDAAHALGSDYQGRKIGGKGRAVCFSFDPIKNITTGEGGAVVTDDDELAEDLRRRRILGIDKETWRRYKNTRGHFYEVTSDGYRYHMPNFSAAVGLVQLRKLPGFVARRQGICRRYDAAFKGLPGLVLLPVDYSKAAPHIYVVKVDAARREAFMEHLKAKGVATGVHYIANHTQPYFKRHCPAPLPLAERLTQEITTLPLHCAMSDADVDTVIAAVRSYFGAF
ncbi:MAG: DegT/DnrJ/EryC1/StrS aminotransferase [Elusimicrobia bacterium]|nr:MAG: DegT/DnrJ/EryC1/StrS aminotransferase [Elusimicrobiota bacterium]